MRMENGPDDDLNDGEERRVGDDANDLITDNCDIVIYIILGFTDMIVREVIKPDILQQH